MRILLTGGTGFIGRRVLDALPRHEVYTPPSCIRPDSLRRMLAAWKPDCCIHCAWEGLPDYSAALCERNYAMAAGVLDMYPFPRFVGVGSCWEYGDRGGNVKEGDAPDTMSLFAATKMAIRLHGERRPGEFVWARPFYVYGPGQRATSLLPSTYRALKKDVYLKIGSPSSAHDFIHVDDVAQGIAALATSPKAMGIYNIGTGTLNYAGHAVNVLAHAMDRSQPFFGDYRFPPNEGLSADCTRIKEICDWQPRSLEQGIKDTLAAWEKQG